MAFPFNLTFSQLYSLVSETGSLSGTVNRTKRICMTFHNLVSGDHGIVPAIFCWSKQMQFHPDSSQEYVKMETVDGWKHDPPVT